MHGGNIPKNVVFNKEISSVNQDGIPISIRAKIISYNIDIADTATGIHIGLYIELIAYRRIVINKVVYDCYLIDISTHRLKVYRMGGAITAYICPNIIYLVAIDCYIRDSPASWPNIDPKSTVMYYIVININITVPTTSSDSNPCIYGSIFNFKTFNFYIANSRINIKTIFRTISINYGLMSVLCFKCYGIP